MRTTIRRLIADESAATHIEYALLAMGGAVLMIGGLTSMSDSLQGFYNKMSELLDSLF